jgi:SPP1 gp7 family putative phage head morphogenesis protein
MMKALFNEKGANLRIDILTEQPAQDFINAHAAALDSSFQQVTMSDAMRQRLQRSDYIFSGIKTFHELNEAFPSLLDSNGNRKPFEQFLNDVQKIDQTYNQNYLRAEYNFVHASATMAAMWEEFQEDGDRYNLQYRTANDDRVRPEHAALDRVTLPMSDPFWAEYYPPNGWNCRCTVVQVRKSKYPVTPHDQAMSLAEEATGKDLNGIFQFNPGIEQKTFPDYNPYTIKRCRDCDIAKGKLDLAFIPENELCAACRKVRKFDVAEMIAELQELSGADFVHQLRKITEMKIFKKVENNIMSAISEEAQDYAYLLAGAKKAVRHGYKVYILPNPTKVRSADYIFVRKGVYKMYDLKTITGTGSIGTRLEESIGQTNRVFINLATTYPTNRMATEIKQYFEANNEALEVLVAVGKKMVSVERNFVMKRTFFKEFRKAVEQ